MIPYSSHWRRYESIGIYRRIAIRKHVLIPVSAIVAETEFKGNLSRVALFNKEL